MKYDITRPDHWVEVPLYKFSTLIRAGSSHSNELSFILNVSATGEQIKPPPDLIRLASGYAEQIGGQVKSTESGRCGIGQFGRAEYTQDELVHGEVWFVSDGVHMFVATYGGRGTPTKEELDEVAEIVKSVTWPRK